MPTSVAEPLHPTRFEGRGKTVCVWKALIVHRDGGNGQLLEQLDELPPDYVGSAQSVMGRCWMRVAAHRPLHQAAEAGLLPARRAPPGGRFAATTVPDFRELASPAIRRKSRDSLLRKSKVAEQFAAPLPTIAREVNPNIANSERQGEMPRKKFPENFSAQRATRCELLTAGRMARPVPHRRRHPP